MEKKTIEEKDKKDDFQGFDARGKDYQKREKIQKRPRFTSWYVLPLSKVVEVLG
jgi:hypothetical protein